MDYEKMYNELKKEHDTLTTTFNTYKENVEKEKNELQTEYDTYKTNSTKEIDDLKQANINLFLQIPKEPRKEQIETPPQETKVTCDDIIKKIGGNL